MFWLILLSAKLVECECVGSERNCLVGSDLREGYSDALLRVVGDLDLAVVDLDALLLALEELPQFVRIVKVIYLGCQFADRLTVHSLHFSSQALEHCVLHVFVGSCESASDHHKSVSD